MEIRRATAGLIIAMIAALSAAPAYAAGSVCTETKSTMVDHMGGDGSECFASSDGHAKAHSSATGNSSFAEADAETKGKANATASGANSFSEASADTGGHSTSKATGAGADADASSDEHGKAKAVANGDGSSADSSAFGKCKGTAMASTGPDGPSNAVADCSHKGTFATATATDGGNAQGFDDQPPICNPGPHGTATVRSSGGNCP